MSPICCNLPSIKRLPGGAGPWQETSCVPARALLSAKIRPWSLLSRIRACSCRGTHPVGVVDHQGVRMPIAGGVGVGIVAQLGQHRGDVGHILKYVPGNVPQPPGQGLCVNRLDHLVSGALDPEGGWKKSQVPKGPSPRPQAGSQAISAAPSTWPLLVFPAELHICQSSSSRRARLILSCVGEGNRLSGEGKRPLFVPNALIYVVLRYYDLWAAQ